MALACRVRVECSTIDWGSLLGLHLLDLLEVSGKHLVQLSSFSVPEEIALDECPAMQQYRRQLAAGPLVAPFSKLSVEVERISIHSVVI